MGTPRCSPQEFHERIAQVQSFCNEEDLGGLLAYSPPKEHKWGQTGHVSYLSGWDNHDRIVDSAVVIPARGAPSLLVAGMPFMLEQIEAVASIAHVRLVLAVDPQAVASVRQSSDESFSFAGQALAVLGANGLAGKEVGVVGVEHMPTPFYEALSAELGAQLRRVPDVVAQLRSIKTPSEVALMRRAAELSDLGFETMLRVARPGMRGIEIVAEMERAVRAQGADHAKYWMASGPPPDWSDTHMFIRPHEDVLNEGDLMGSCSYVLYRGYWCHGHRTGSLTRPCPELEALCDAGRKAQDAGLALARPGAVAGDVGRAIRRQAAAGGLGIQGGRFGHGMGMDYTELPSLAEASDGRLEAGMTFVLHTAFELPESGKMLVPLGDVCHLTPDGPELLMNFPRTPFLAGA